MLHTSDLVIRTATPLHVFLEERNEFVLKYPKQFLRSHSTGLESMKSTMIIQFVTFFR